MNSANRSALPIRGLGGMALMAATRKQISTMPLLRSTYISERLTTKIVPPKDKKDVDVRDWVDASTGNAIDDCINEHSDHFICYSNFKNELTFKSIA